VSEVLQIPGGGKLSDEIALSTMQSHARAGLAKGTLIFCLPGSNGACKDGWDKLVRWQLDSRHRPCSLAELMPRFLET
jgi:molybdenum cofactor biosynthesis protein B